MQPCLFIELMPTGHPANLISTARAKMEVFAGAAEEPTARGATTISAVRSWAVSCYVLPTTCPVENPCQTGELDRDAC